MLTQSRCATRKTNILIYKYKLFQSATTRTDSVEDTGIFNYKLYFHNLVNFVSSHRTTLLGLVRSVTFIFSSLESIVTCRGSCVTHKKGVWFGWLDLLTSYTQYSVLQAIITLSLIHTLHSSPYTRTRVLSLH
jgi:hypothetical protein